MKESPILSIPHEDDPRPWAEFEVTDGSLEVTMTNMNGLGAFHQHNVRAIEPIRRRTPEQAKATLKAAHGKRRLKLSKNFPHEMHLLAINLDGDVVFHPVSEYEPYYYANLAYYHPDTGEWERLVFKDGSAIMPLFLVPSTESKT